MKYSYQNGHLKKSKHLLKMKIKKVYNPKTLKQIARKNIKIKDKVLEKERDRKMINP